MRKLKILIVVSLCLSCFSESFSAIRIVDEQEFSQKNNLNPKDTIDNFVNRQGKTKGQFLLHLSLPYINSFHFNPENEKIKNNTGFMGYSVGLDYLYNTTQYLNISFAQIQDFFLPIAFVDKGDEYELMSSSYISLSNNHKINRLSVGYGLSFAQNSWDLKNHSWDENSSAREPVKKTSNAFGLVSSTYFQIIKSFYLGVIYRPTFYRLNIEPTFKYEHSISIDFTWKIPLNK